MKLREFVANSLPRVRGRKKKVQPQKTTVTKERNDGNQPKCQTSHQQSSSVIYQEPNARSTLVKPMSDSGSNNQSLLSELRSETHPTIPQYDSCNEYQIAYLNTSLDETNYVSNKDICGFLSEQERNSLLIYSSDCERHGNARKSRSRIRTNPWLPSPSSTPYNASRAFPIVLGQGSHTTSSCADQSEERCYSDKDVFMETDVSPTTPGSTDSGFKSSVSSDINVKQNASCVVPRLPEENPTPKREKANHCKKKSKVLKASESFDSCRSSGGLQEVKLSVRSQTTVDIDSVACCHDNGQLDKLKWRHHHDLSLVSPPLNSANSFEWEDSSIYMNCEKGQELFQTTGHNISVVYENLNCYQDNTVSSYDPSNTSILELITDDVTKEVAVQTDFEDNEDSDWMTASSFDDTLDLTNQSPRKLSLISDCMQESTDTGYSSLTREGLLELDEDFQFFSNKENISNSLNGWLENKEHFKTPVNMGQSWCEGSTGRNIADQGNSLNNMCHSWYEGSNKDHFESPITMTSSIYIPAAEAVTLRDPMRETQPKSTTAETKVENKTAPTSKTYAPVLEYGPVIRKPTSESKTSEKLRTHKHSRSEQRANYKSDTEIRSTHVHSPSEEDVNILNATTLSDDIETAKPTATSTPVDERIPDVLRHRTRANIMDNVKAQMSSVGSRAINRPRAKKPDSRKPRDNLDVIRDYLGYASFEDFYFAKKCPPLSTGRTLNQIKTSLEEKVDQLRQEKLIVEQKICEAQEEDRIKKHEKLKFQKQLHYQRKQMLLKTLHDLKDKLENQSDRLQKSYSTILNLQSRFTHRQSTNSLLRSGPM